MKCWDAVVCGVLTHGKGAIAAEGGGRCSGNVTIPIAKRALLRRDTLTAILTER